MHTHTGDIKTLSSELTELMIVMQIEGDKKRAVNFTEAEIEDLNTDIQKRPFFIRKTPIFHP